MYIEHPFLQQPREDARLWRYMTPTVFLSMLLGRSLFFSRLSRFEDPFEGVPPKEILEAMAKQDGGARRSPPDDLNAWKEMIQMVRTSVCANCWHVGAEESEAMWKLYGRYEDGVAVVATPSSIRETFRNHDITGGLVDYSGKEFRPGTTEQNLLQWATTKRPSYKYENEYRLLARCNQNDEQAGISLTIDPQVLVHEVVLSPGMERWQSDLFRALIDTLRFERPVRDSSLLTAPW